MDQIAYKYADYEHLSEDEYTDVSEECQNIVVALRDKQFLENLRSHKRTHVEDEEFRKRYFEFCIRNEGKQDIENFALDDIVTAAEAMDGLISLDDIFKFCYENNCNVLNFLVGHIMFECEVFFIHARKRDPTAIYEEGAGEKLARILALKALSLLGHIVDMDKVYGDDFVMNSHALSLQNSFITATDAIHDFILEYIDKMPIKNVNIDIKNILYDLERMEDDCMKVFTSRKSYGQFNGGNHFLSKLKDDELFCAKNGEPCFENFTESLIIGYTSKAILLGVDKNSTIRQLETKIKHLEDYNDSESEKLIEYTRKVIEFIRGKKHANTLPFKTIGKLLGMSKNEAKNFARKVLDGNFNETIFLQTYNSTTKDISYLE